jgi:hypothetical protein
LRLASQIIGGQLKKAVFSGACATLAAAETTRQAIKGYESTRCSVVHLTTIKCGATFGASIELLSIITHSACSCGKAL